MRDDRRRTCRRWRRCGPGCRSRGCRRRGRRRRARGRPGSRCRRRPSTIRSAPGGRGGPCPTPVGSSGCGGSRSKLCGGGGDVVAHSSVCPPHGSLPGRRAALAGPPHVPEERQRRRAEQERADRRHAVERGEPVVGQVAGDPAGHALDAELVLHEERQVEADEHQHEVHPAPALVQQPAGELREPVVDAGEQRERRAAEQHVVHVGDDEVRVVELEVDGRRGEHHAGQPAGQEQEQEPDGEEHRRRERRAGPATSSRSS